MRKILTSVLSVAGLLAVVLALASSPASATKVVVKFATGTAGTADISTVGTYTVSWETQGGCDPGSGTSGASGSASVTVTGATPTAPTGDDQEIGVVIDNICNYDYKYSYVTAAGAACALTVTVTDADTAGGEFVVGEACTSPVKVVVTIVGAIDVAEELCTEADLDNDVAGCAGDATTTTVKTAEGRNTRNDGAVSKTEFTVTATVAGDDPNENCAGDSADSETGEDGANTVTLSLVDTTFDGGTCKYDVTAALPAGFTADDDSNVAPGVDPVANDPDDEDDNPADNRTLTVSVAAVNVYLVQNVMGDAGGASASYSGFAPPAVVRMSSTSRSTEGTDVGSVVDQRYLQHRRSHPRRVAERPIQHHRRHQR